MAAQTHSRRRFLQLGLGATALGAATLVRPGFGRMTQGAPLYDISLAEWSLHRRLFGRRQPKLDHLDFAQTAAGLGIHAVEYVNQFFKDKARDEAYLGEMKKRAKDAGVRSLLIMIDGEGALGASDTKQREQAVKNHHQWVEAARFLGCHSIRVNARSDHRLPPAEQMKLAADGLRKLCEYGDRFGINVIVENHGGLSSNGKWLVGVMKLVDHPRCGTLPDFGNFEVDHKKHVWYDRYEGVREMMPYAKAVSAKSHEFRADKPWSTFDRAGHETDYLKMMGIVIDAGYHGFVGIEFEGSGNEMEGIKRTKQLLLRVREKLAAAGG